MKERKMRKGIGDLQRSVGAAFHVCGGWAEKGEGLHEPAPQRQQSASSILVSHRVDPHCCDATATQRGLGLVAAYRVIILRVDRKRYMATAAMSSPVEFPRRLSDYRYE